MKERVLGESDGSDEDWFFVLQKALDGTNDY